MKHYSFIMLALLILAGCSKNEHTSIVRDDYSKTLSSNSISVDEALQSLQNFQSQLTKSDTRQIERIVSIPNPYSGSTKSGSNEGSDILYVVNYKDDAGYAILSADRRLPTEVYALVDSGTVAESDVYNDNVVNPANLVYQSVVRSISPVVDTTTDDPFLPPGGQPIEPIPFDPPDGEWVVTEWGPWNTDEYIPQMLLTKWHQDSPFNDLVAPKDAGCTPIALFQIIAYNMFPPNYKIGQVSIPLNIMREIDVIAPMSQYAYPAALFVKYMHDSYHNSHWGDQTLMFPIAAKNHLEYLGYRNVEIHRDPSEFDITIVLNSLRMGYPVLISAIANITSGHTWVLDGYVRQHRVGGEYGEESGDYYGSKTEERVMLHCNWGWRGNHDGYFYAGVFDFNQPANFIPTATQLGSADHFDSYYRLVTYEIY